MYPQTKYHAGSQYSRRQLLKLTGGAAVAWGLAACATPSSLMPAGNESAAQPQDPKRGGILRIVPPDTPVNLDPARFASTADGLTASTAYEGLVMTDIGDSSFPILPMLAESWETSEDGLQWTFHLRQGVTFHHGTPFTAKDVVYTFERVRDPALASPARDRTAYIKMVEAIDDHTVVFTLDAPVVTLLQTLGDQLAGLAIVPHDRTADQLAKEVSGTGPFQVSEYVPGERTVFKRYEKYWGDGLPYLDGLQHIYIAESATQIASLVGGTTDVIFISSENVATLQDNPDVQIVQNALGFHDLFVMRADQEPFTDVRVRQAFKLAIDRPALQQVVLRGQGSLGNDQPVPPNNPFWADLPIPQQDFAKAKQLLTEAGYPDGVNVTLTFAEIIPTLPTACVALQEMVKPAGITIELQRVAMDAYWTQYYMQTPFFVSVWGNAVDPDSGLSLIYQSDAIFNESGWKSPELDALIAAGRIEADATKRKEIYAQVQKLISEEGCSIIPYFSPTLLAARSNVQDLLAGLFPACRAVWLA